MSHSYSHVAFYALCICRDADSNSHQFSPARMPREHLESHQSSQKTSVQIGKTCLTARRRSWMTGSPSFPRGTTLSAEWRVQQTPTNCPVVVLRKTYREFIPNLPWFLLSYLPEALPFNSSMYSTLISSHTSNSHLPITLTFKSVNVWYLELLYPFAYMYRWRY